MDLSPDTPPRERPPEAPVAPDREERRLHPMTLVRRLLASLPGFAFLLLPVFRAGDGEAYFSLVLAIVFGVVAVPLSIAFYVRFRYQLTPREIVIRSGVLTRRDRNIPVERIQNVEIEQGLLARMTGTAKVKIETAGSTTTEGVLDLVSLEEAHRIRRAVRAFQRAAPGAAAGPAEAPEHEGDTARPAAAAAPSLAVAEAAERAEGDDEASVELFAMPLRRVLLSGVFRFSLLYIAILYSGFEYLGVDPVEVVDRFERGRYGDAGVWVTTSPWLAAGVTVALAALFAWITGILVNLNRYYRFRLGHTADKLHKRSGLLTVVERTIPLAKIQTIIFRSNPLMRRFDWWRLEVQTMGLDVEQQGHQVAAPFAREGEVHRLAGTIRPVDVPGTFRPVSRLHVRRTTIRYALFLGVLVGGVALLWRPALWTLLALPLAYGLAELQYRNHGYTFGGGFLFVRRGWLRHHVWAVPVDRFQTIERSASLFQRRLGLGSVTVDTAGAAPLAYPVIHDLPAEEAEALLARLHDAFRAPAAEPTAPSDAALEDRPDERSDDISGDASDEPADRVWDGGRDAAG